MDNSLFMGINYFGGFTGSGNESHIILGPTPSEADRVQVKPLARMLTNAAALKIEPLLTLCPTR